MNLTKYLIIFLFFTLGLSCKKDQNEYRMENKDFIMPVYFEQLYQQALIKTLANIPGDIAINAFALKRLQLTEMYLSELTAATKTGDWPAAGNLPDDKIQKLAEVNSPIPENKIKIIGLLKISDQDMIGFHVKASGPLGLKDKAVRDWANDKLSALFENLDEIQDIK